MVNLSISHIEIKYLLYYYVFRAIPFEILRGADWRLKIKMCGGAFGKKIKCMGGALAQKIKCGGGVRPKK